MDGVTEKELDDEEVKVHLGIDHRGIPGSGIRQPLLMLIRRNWSDDEQLRP